MWRRGGAAARIMATAPRLLVPPLRIRRRPRRRLPSPRRSRQTLLVALAAALLGAGCVDSHRHSSGRVFPLPRQQPGDGLAVVNGPGGRGIHIWLDPNSETPGLCRPRWHPDPARLEGGDGPQPRSGGRAPRQEFYDALRRGKVRLALRQQMALLCRQRAPRSRFQWQPPPRSDEEFLPVRLPLVEEEHLLSHPTAVRRNEKQQLGLPLTPEDWDDRWPPRPADGP